VTLTNVTVTDAQVSNLTCTPSNPVASLAPGGTINCTASHTIGQADLDAGSFFNKACVDDGAGPAAEACADVTTTGTQNPHLKITKVATETTYSAVGDVIHYTIVATNDGNVTLHNVLVTDPNASNLTCTPSNPVASLAPGGTINCTANHTIVQADIDATHYLNQACVDDGTGGAAQACASVNTPATLTASQITPTQTTCQQFSAGTSSTLSAVSYSVKSGAVSQVAPGVFFYWVKVTATAGANTFTIGQTSNVANFQHFFNIASGSSVYNSSCVKVVTQTITQSGKTTTVKFTAPTAGTYVIGIKYDTGSVVGFTAPNPATVHYSLSTTGVANSTSGLDLVKK